MKIDVVKICAGLIIVLALLMCSSVATETTWRHSGFELWGYDINFTDHNASNIHLLHADYLHGDCSNVTNINASNISIGELPLAQIPNTLTGKDADTVDGYHAADLISSVAVSNGTYAGNNIANRAIPHGLGIEPKTVFILSPGYGFVGIIMSGSNTTCDFDGFTATVTAMDHINFYVGNVVNYDKSMNSNIRTYYWMAIV